MNKNDPVNVAQAEARLKDSISKLAPRRESDPRRVVSYGNLPGAVIPGVASSTADRGGHVNVRPQTLADQRGYTKSLPEVGLDDSPKAIEQDMRRERGGSMKIDSSKTMMGKEIK